MAGGEPAITRVSKQIRHETLQLYYECNIFTFVQPSMMNEDWYEQSVFVSFLKSLGAAKCKWLKQIVLIYWDPADLGDNIEYQLLKSGLSAGNGKESVIVETHVRQHRAQLIKRRVREWEYGKFKHAETIKKLELDRMRDSVDYDAVDYGGL